MTIMLINYSDAQGSPAAAIGSYLIRYRERKRQKALKANHRSRAFERQVVIDCEGFYSYLKPCRGYY